MNKPMSAVVRSAALLSPTGQDRTSQDRTTVPFIANRSATRRNLPEQIATEQLHRLDELALIGYPTSWDEATRDVVYTALRLGAERALDNPTESEGA